MARSAAPDSVSRDAAILVLGRQGYETAVEGKNGFVCTMVMAGRSKAEIVSAIKAAFENQQPPNLESGAMAYMKSKSAYLTDEGDHNGPHLMFYTLVKDSKDWSSGAAGSPVVSSPYWFFSPKEQSQMKGLPPILVFAVVVTNWPDGTPEGKNND